MLWEFKYRRVGAGGAGSNGGGGGGGSSGGAVGAGSTFELHLGANEAPIACNASHVPNEDGHCAGARLARAASANDALARFKELRIARATRPTEVVGSAQFDLTAAAAETLQILGQIVVDRASAKAYELLQGILKDLLDCSSIQTTRFQSTCATLGTLRIEDIATAPTVLFGALAQDMIRRIGLTGGDIAPALPIVSVLTSTVIPLLAKPTAFQTPAIQTALETIVSSIADKTDVSSLPAAQKTVALGVLAYATCTATTTSQSAVAACDVGAIIDKLDPTANDPPKGAAVALAARLLAIATAPKADIPHVQLAVDTLFSTACMLEAGRAAPSSVPTLACPSIDTLSGDPTKNNVDPKNIVALIAFTDAVVDAALALDGERLVVVASKFLDLTLQSNDSVRKKRAMHLLGGLLDYAATYATPASSSSTTADNAATSAHDQRTKILESLTKEMSDRSGREGDDIFSLGGSLRTIGGVRIGTTDAGGASFFGPLSLTLGIAYTHIPKKDNYIGIHVQLDAVDFGNYLALDNGPTVKTPEIGDVFAPSVTVGFAYGTGLPLVVGLTAGWTPQFALDANQPDKRGSVNVGLTVGIHVPLIDLN